MSEEIAGPCDVCGKPVYWQASYSGGISNRSLMGMIVGMAISKDGHVTHEGSYRHQECLGRAPDRLTLYETALRTIQEACARYIHPEGDMTMEAFIDEVLGAADNRDLVRAMRTSEPSNAIVDEGMEKRE